MVLAQRGRMWAPTLMKRPRPTIPDYAQGLSSVRKTVIVLDSSPWKSWSENNDRYNRSGLSAEPAGLEMAWREMVEEPPVETPQSWERRGQRLRRETNRLICGHVAKTVKEKSFAISLPFKNVCSVLSSLCRVKLFLHQGYTKTKLLAWPRCPICHFSHVRLEGYKIYRNCVQPALNMMKNQWIFFKIPPDLKYVCGYLCSFRKDIFSFKSTLLAEYSFIFFNVGIKLITLDKWLNVSPAGIISN